jgi:hypothetical protein
VRAGLETPVKTMPGQVYDRRGVPIYPGDLIRHYHFTGARRKRYYLYHVAVWSELNQTMELVPTCHMDPAIARDNPGGRYWLIPDTMIEPEVIHGSGPGSCLDFDDRPKRK